MELAAFEQTAI